MAKSRKNAHDIGSWPKRGRNALTKKIAPYLAKAQPAFSISNLKRPVFLIGCHRSGTTLLGRLLDMHKDIANWTEANEIWDPYWFPWREENMDKPPLEYDPYAFTDRWWSENESRMDEIKAYFGAFQFLHRKPFFMNKSPYNVFRLPYLLEHFPDAKFVHIIRDGRAVVNSHIIKLIEEDHLRKWPPEEQAAFNQSKGALAERLGNYWNASIEEVEKQTVDLKLEEKGIIYTTVYDNLCDDPIKILTEICNFIGVDPNRFIRGVENQKIKNSNYKWREELDAETIDRMIKVMHPKLSEYGFLLKD